MNNQAANLKERIGALGDKQAIHIANSLVQAAFTSRTFADLNDNALLGRVTDQVQALDQRGELGALRSDPDWANKPFGGRAAGDLARRGLQALAEQPGESEFVARALDEFFDAQADFGVLTGAAALRTWRRHSFAFSPRTFCPGTPANQRPVTRAREHRDEGSSASAPWFVTSTGKAIAGKGEDA
jgi:hypothetical protein